MGLLTDVKDFVNPLMTAEIISALFLYSVTVKCSLLWLALYICSEKDFFGVFMLLPCLVTLIVEHSIDCYSAGCS